MESDNPDIQWALELLKPDPSIQKSFLKKYQMYAVASILAPCAIAYANRARELPLLSRKFSFFYSYIYIYAKIFFGALGYLIFILFGVFSK